MRRSSRLVHLTACLGSALANAQESRPAPFHVEAGPGKSHAVLVFDAAPGQDGPPAAQKPGAASEQATPDRPQAFDAAGWPARQEPAAAARRKQALDPADQAFVTLSSVVMEVQFTGLGEDGQELFQRRARLEMSALPGGEERLTFGDGRVYQRFGTHVQATQGQLSRPDLLPEAEVWLDAVTWFVRMPHPTTLGGGPRGSFDLLAQSGGSRADATLVRTFGRGDERLHVFVDPVTSGATQVLHSPGEGQVDRSVLLSEACAVGSYLFPTVRTVLGPDGKRPVLRVRFSHVRARSG